ncbi:MAG: hypothetical protein K6A23_11365 [Butyrivibrio sp.]|nr:hypothetical protein [Butyrivibrio sp.]
MDGFNNTMQEALQGIEVSSYHKEDKYEIVSKVAYLLGIAKPIFENESNGFDVEIYKSLSKNTATTIIRHLCILRNQMEHHFGQVCKAIQQEYKSIYMLPEMIPTESLKYLGDNGIDLFRYKNEPGAFIIEINKQIKSRINNCKDVFPSWINFEFIRDIFIMPNGTTDEGLKENADFFYANIDFYPYKTYLNWPAKDEGNILFNDKRFVSLLYEWNGEFFVDNSKVSDASEHTKETIYDFIDAGEKIVFVVDCENSDPYDLFATINNLEAQKLEKIEKIILYDDVHAASAWELLADYVKIPVEYILIERLKDNKSLADIKLAAGTCREFYKNNVDSFVLVSSDSDYWGLIESIPEAKFLVMVEHEKCSGAMKSALINKGIYFCYIDDFYSGNSQELKKKAMLKETNKLLADGVHINVNDLIKEMMQATHIILAPNEVEDFKKKYLNKLEIDINSDGNLEIKIRMK